MELALAAGLADRIVAAFGDDGRCFVDTWRSTLEEVVREWKLELTESLPSSYGAVFAGRCKGGAEVVLKLRVPGAEARAETQTLAWYAGIGAVPVLASDDERGALLLPRLRPAHDLRSIHEEAAVEAVADLVERLTSPRPGAVPADLPTTEAWGKGFARSGLGHPAVDAAERIFRDLCASAAAPVVLHGDLHHENVLAHGDGWLAVDPHGVLGEPAYEIGAFVRNPITTIASDPDAPAVVARRLDVFAERLRLDRPRLHGWSYAQAVLSACWDVEEGGDPARSLRIAEIIGAP